VKVCGPESRLSHFSAAALFGFVDWDDRLPEVTIPGPGTRLHRGIRVHRSSVLAPTDCGIRRTIPVTSAARTLIDLGSQMDEKQLRRAVRRAQSLRCVRLEELVEVIRRLRPRPGVRALARVVGSEPAPTRSVLEDIVLDLILGAGFVHPDVNVPLLLGNRTVIPDFRWPTRRIVLEADGAAWHDHKVAREDDAERQALLEAHGERVVRVTWQQAMTRAAETLARLRAAGVPLASGVELLGRRPSKSTSGGLGG
jgi:hypothetical protein